MKLRRHRRPSSADPILGITVLTAGAISGFARKMHVMGQWKSSRPPAHQRPATVLVVDDHKTFTDLVRMALESEPDLACVGTAHDVRTARAMVEEHDPDVVLMDVNLGAEDGLELTADLVAANPALRVVVLTAHGEATVTRRAVAAGACAVLPKDGSLPELLHGLHTASTGSVAVHPSLLRKLVNGEQHAPPDDSVPLSPLTPREMHVLQLLAQGRDVRAISRELHISVNTCRGHVKNVLMKLGAHSQLEAVVVAGVHGLVETSGRR